eukprot:2341930-Lingulodinium_polyedra.AAC.1
MERPACRLLKAQYGHPESVVLWKQKCDTHSRKVVFEPRGPEWPSCYFHAGSKLFLIIYVDDFQLSGLSSSMPE